MSVRSTLSESFLDGFSMAGFTSRLRRPVEARQMFAPISSDWQPLAFEPSSTQSGGVEIAGDLHSVPGPQLAAMIDILRREGEQRQASAAHAGKVLHGTSR